MFFEELLHVLNIARSAGESKVNFSAICFVSLAVVTGDCDRHQDQRYIYIYIYIYI